MRHCWLSIRRKGSWDEGGEKPLEAGQGKDVDSPLERIPKGNPF